MDRDRRLHYAFCVPRRSAFASLALFSALSSMSVSACKPAVVSPEECTAIADHLGKLQVKKEKLPPMGRLASPPFNGPENERGVFEEARDNAKTRCLKGWKREVFECMQQVQTIEEADRCRLK